MTHPNGFPSCRNLLPLQRMTFELLPFGDDEQSYQRFITQIQSTLTIFWKQLRRNLIWDSLKALSSVSRKCLHIWGLMTGRSVIRMFVLVQGAEMKLRPIDDCFEAQLNFAYLKLQDVD